MGIDFGAIFGNISNQVDKAWTDVKNTGVPAVEASLEKWGADTLSGMAKNSQATVDTNVKEILARPSDPNGLGAYLANTIKSPVVQQYGGYILAAVAVVGIGAVLIFSKRGLK